MSWMSGCTESAECRFSNGKVGCGKCECGLVDVSQHSEVSFQLVPSRNVVWTKDSGQSPDLEEQLQACRAVWSWKTQTGSVCQAAASRRKEVCQGASLACTRTKDFRAESRLQKMDWFRVCVEFWGKLSWVFGEVGQECEGLQEKPEVSQTTKMWCERASKATRSGSKYQLRDAPSVCRALNARLPEVRDIKDLREMQDFLNGTGVWRVLAGIHYSKPTNKFQFDSDSINIRATELFRHV